MALSRNLIGSVSTLLFSYCFSRGIVCNIIATSIHSARPRDQRGPMVVCCEKPSVVTSEVTWSCVAKCVVDGVPSGA